MGRSTPIAGLLIGVLAVVLAGCGADRPDRAETVPGPTASPPENDQVADALTTVRSSRRAVQKVILPLTTATHAAQF